VYTMYTCTNPVLNPGEGACLPFLKIGSSVVGIAGSRSAPRFIQAKKTTKHAQAGI